MTLNEFRADKRLVAEAQRLFQDPVFSTILSIMDKSSPNHYRVVPKNGEGDYLWGTAMGYDMALANLESFIQPSITTEQSTLTASYGSSEEEDTKDG